jgi:hypothetical protein
MNIEQANTIPISLLLDNLAIKPARKSGNNLYYLSPIRNERTASFHVNTTKNVWYDHGIGIGGDCVAFACKRLEFLGEDHNVPDALRWIENMSGQGRIIVPIHVPDEVEQQEEKNFVIKKIQPISEEALIDYLDSRGIPLKVARKYLKEIRTYNKELKKHFFALGFKNESDGYELRNKYFKGCVNSKDVTLIRGSKPKPDGVHVFEGFMDFLSIIVQNEGKPLRDDAIILNSISCLKEAMALVKGYGYQVAYTWLDNDEAGKSATTILHEFFQTEKSLVHEPMNSLYLPYKDVNASHMIKLGLGNDY